MWLRRDAAESLVVHAAHSASRWWLACLCRFQIVYSPGDPSQLHYCKQVTSEEYNRQKVSNSQGALRDLLDEIINDAAMSDKNKKKRLKQVCFIISWTLPKSNLYNATDFSKLLMFLSKNIYLACLKFTDTVMKRSNVFQNLF